MGTTTLMTADDLAALPDDGYRYELDRGVLVRMPPPKLRHGLVTSRFARLLGDHVDERGLGAVGTESGFLLARDPDRVVAPDVFFIRADRLPPDDEQDRYLPFPDLAVEVLSPSDSMSDVSAKVLDYLAAGTLMVVVLDPRRRTATTYGLDRRARLLTEEDELDLSDVLPGFRVPLADIFR